MPALSCYGEPDGRLLLGSGDGNRRMLEHLRRRHQPTTMLRHGAEKFMTEKNQNEVGTSLPVYEIAGTLTPLLTTAFASERREYAAMLASSTTDVLWWMNRAVGGSMVRTSKGLTMRSITPHANGMRFGRLFKRLFEPDVGKLLRDCSEETLRNLNEILERVRYALDKDNPPASPPDWYIKKVVEAAASRFDVVDGVKAVFHTNPDEIEYVYSDTFGCGESCMVRERAVRCYGDSPNVALAALYDVEDEDCETPLARAVVNTSNKTWVRIYSVEHALYMVAKLGELGYEESCDSLGGEKIRALQGSSGYMAPYIDSDAKHAYLVEEDDGAWWHLGYDGPYLLTGTNGYPEGTTTMCLVCEDDVDEDDLRETYVVNRQGELETVGCMCLSCIDTHTTHAYLDIGRNSMGYVANDDTIAVGDNDDAYACTSELLDSVVWSEEDERYYFAEDLQWDCVVDAYITDKGAEVCLDYSRGLYTHADNVEEVYYEGGVEAHASECDLAYALTHRNRLQALVNDYNRLREHLWGSGDAQRAWLRAVLPATRRIFEERRQAARQGASVTLYSHPIDTVGLHNDMMRAAGLEPEGCRSLLSTGYTLPEEELVTIAGRGVELGLDGDAAVEAAMTDMFGFASYTMCQYNNYHLGNAWAVANAQIVNARRADSPRGGMWILTDEAAELMEHNCEGAYEYYMEQLESFGLASEEETETEGV